ncbi:PLP-dependent aminotransferase family protein [Colwellia sp. 1_MG-2023]|uniref:MocR-like pyridoxine biosynthesis transcription factor PdxR n=1 Tax=Colwellia sp. 1_MG-2023 TaxID=3062649 RepID=UPI0026E14FBF|nr:PLP-dependent aminotransferase family protein [Colwellia sp. 1_MG-2023]MDO6447513.1 PLP-dependent aminotransferase family protein [Colwellia sp. 1_MG-2023]
MNIAHAIRHAITQGHVAPSENLPSARILAKQLQVNRHTIMAAYQELIAQGWVESKERQGYQVSKNLPVHQVSQTEQTAFKNEIHYQWQIVKDNSTKSQKPASQFLYNFAGGNPDISIFPFNDFRSHMNAALSRPAIKELNYGDNAGFPSFIHETAKYLRRVRSIKDKEIIVVNGTQEALYILSQVLLTKGDKVAVESLGYRPAWQAFESAGAELIGINQTNQGIDVKHLESMLKKHSIKLLYLTPLHQYPTTTTLPVSERINVYRLAQKYNVAIIEDDYDHEFHYDTQPLAPMAATDPSGLIIYLSSFSKLMFPAMRLGIMAVDKSLAPHLINYRTMVNHKANIISQDAVSRWMKEGGFERHLRKATRIYQKRRQCMVNLLTAFQQEGLAINFSVPPGGMALWVDVGKNAEQIALKAKELDIFILAENAFHLMAERNQNRFIRLGFSGQNEENIQQGLLLLKPLLQRG